MTASRLVLFYSTGVLPILIGLLLLSAWPSWLLGDGERVAVDTSGAGIDVPCIVAHCKCACERCVNALLRCSTLVGRSQLMERAKEGLRGPAEWLLAPCFARMRRSSAAGDSANAGACSNSTAGSKRPPTEVTGLLAGAAAPLPRALPATECLGADLSNRPSGM